MAENMTEDEVRDKAREILGLNSVGGGVIAGVGQLTTFNQLGFKGRLDKPDGWYISRPPRPIPPWSWKPKRQRSHSGHPR